MRIAFMASMRMRDFIRDLDGELQTTSPSAGLGWEDRTNTKGVVVGFLVVGVKQ